MKILLLEDVYKLGRAGEVKKVANGYGRNYLIPHGLAMLATPGALKQVEYIRDQATTKRAILNQELAGVAEQLAGVVLTFPAKAGETGKLYGSITSKMVVDAIQEKVGVEIDRRHLDVQPIRTLGDHQVQIRLTLDLIQDITVIVHREGEAPVLPEAEPAADSELATESEPEIEEELVTEDEPEAEAEATTETEQAEDEELATENEPKAEAEATTETTPAEDEELATEDEPEAEAETMVETEPADDVEPHAE